jgi:uncharacterized protein
MKGLIRSRRSLLSGVGVLWVVLLLIGAGPAMGQAQVPPPGRPEGELPSTSLTVMGQGEVMVDADRAFVALGTTAQAENAEQAQQRVNEVMQRAIQAIREHGIEREAIRTQRLTLHPVYSEQRMLRPEPAGRPERPQEPRIVGYRASNIVEVRLDELEKVGSVIDAGMSEGMNQVEGVRFELRDPTRAQQEALRRAAQQATRKAQGLAEALEMRLDGLVHIYEATAPVMPLRMERAMVAAEGFATPVEPGQIQVQAQVTLIYRTAAAGGD